MSKGLYHLLSHDETGDMTRIEDAIKKNNRDLAAVLAVIGLVLLWRSMYFGETSQSYVLLTNLGTAFIVTAVATLIVSHTVKGIETKFSEEMHELASKIDILSEVKKCKIVHIFESRRKDPNFAKELIKQFKNTKPNEEVLMLSISLRDFFGPRANSDYQTVIINMIKRGIKLKILLLDPTSKAAKARALVEERERIKSFKYINSTVFKEIRDVAEWLAHPSVGVDLAGKMSKQIEVRFYRHDPTTHIIRTDKFTFIEQYHRGGDLEIRKDLERRDGILLIDCFGGFVPVLMVDNSAPFAKLMKSHFKNIWDSDDIVGKGLSIDELYAKILSFEVAEREKISQPIVVESR